MQIGAHVSASGGLLPALERGAAIGADAVQIFTQSPRAWKPSQYDADLLSSYRDAQASHESVQATFCHASYLINLATSSPDLLAKSRDCLRANLLVASAIGAGGLILHVGSHLGVGLDAVLGQVAACLLEALDTVEAELGAGGSAPILIENAAGAGGTVGRSFEEIAAIVEAAGGDPRLGTCLDTQHLFASGVDFGDEERADSVVAGLDRLIGLDRLQAIHLNDSKVGFGENKDRHENLGDGLIGARALGALLSHPSLQSVPALLEVPGADGKGPGASDVTAARRIHAGGIRRRKTPAAAQSAERRPRAPRPAAR